MNFAHACKNDPQVGFTLIEIVMVLVLLGILAAVAVPKYFDLQEEAAAKMCMHNRAVVLESLTSRSALAHIENDTKIFDHSKGQEMSEEITAELGGDNCTYNNVCPRHCPSGGVFEVKYSTDSADNVYFEVKCTKHGATSSSDPSNSSGTSGGKKITENVQDFETWLKENYNDQLDHFFTESKDGNANAIIDSEHGNYDALWGSLAEYGFNKENSIFQITRKDIGFVDDSGNVHYCSDKEAADNGWHWKSVMTITVANKSDIQEGTVTGTQYTMDVDFNTKNSETERTGNLGDLKTVGDSDGKVDCTVTEENGVTVIRPNS